MPRYQVKELPFGFEIEGGAERTPVKVMALETCWAITHDGKQFQLGLFEIGELASLCSKIAISNWKPLKSASSFNLGKWMYDLTRKTLSKIISAQFKRIRAKLNPTVIDVQKSVFTSTMKCGEIAINPDFYKCCSSHILKDIISYRPAAVALGYIGSPYAVEKFSLPLGDTAVFEKQRAENFENPQGTGHCLPMHRAIELLEDWRALYSPNRVPYTALNRTLMNCPAISAFSLGRLHECFLERPVLNRLELMLNIEADRSKSRHKNLLIKSTELDIQKALKMVAEVTRRNLSTIKLASIAFLINYLNDYPGKHFDGKIVGLTRKSIRWHQEQASLTKEEILSKYGQMVFPAPPIPLPTMNDAKINIRYLSNAAEVAIEAELMGHCIGNYVDKAMNGESFLFHLDHLASGTCASVEVNFRGEVIQSCGPRNCTNLATKAGTRLLKSWGRNIPNGAKLLKANPKEIEPMPF